MNELRNMEVDKLFRESLDTFLRAENDAEAAPKKPNKPGPKPKENPRSEKISCRLTPKEKAMGLRYCKAHGTTEAKLLRASYLAAIMETPSGRIDRFLDSLMKPLDSMELLKTQKQEIRARTKEVLKKSAMALILILLSAAALTPTLIKFWGDPGRKEGQVLERTDTCVYYTDGKHGDKSGCEVQRLQGATPDPRPPEIRTPDTYCDDPPTALCNDQSKMQKYRESHPYR